MADNCIERLKKLYPTLSTIELKNLDVAFRTLDENYKNRLDLLNSKRKAMYDQVEFAAYEREMAELTHIKNIRTNLEHVMQPAFRGQSDMGLNSLVMTTPFNARGQSRNASQIAENFQGKYEAMLRQGLQKNGAINLISDPEFARNVYREFYDRYYGNGSGKYGQTVTDAVDAIIKTNKAMINSMRNVGSTIRYNETHLVAQNYDASKILKDVDTWVQDMADSIDYNESFGPSVSTREDAIAVLRNMATRMENIDLEKKDFRFSLVGGKRAIVYKNGDSAFDMTTKYGYSDLAYGLNSGVKRLAKKYGLVSVFGNDPARGIAELKDYVRGVATVTPDFQTFDSGVNLLRGTGNKFKDPDGIIAKAVVPATNASKNLSTMALLGASAPKILMDLPLTAFVNKAQGGSLFKATSHVLTDALGSLVKGKEGRRKTAEMLYQIMDDHKMRMYAEMGGLKENGLGITALEKFYKWTGMSMIGEITKEVAMKNSLRVFRETIKQGPTNELRLNDIKRAGLSGQEATTLRKILEETGDVSPYHIENSTIGSPKQRELLAQKVASHLTGLTDQSITTTDPRIQVALRQDKPIDDPGRIAFKLYSTFLTSITKETMNTLKIARTISPTGKVTSKTGIAALTSVAVTMALWDYATDEIKKIASGKWEDVDPSKEDIKKHMLDSGAWGLLIGSVIKGVQGRNPIGTPAPLRMAGKLTDHIKNEWEISTGEIRRPKNDAFERQFNFMLEMSPYEKFWATGLIKAINDNIIEDTGRRKSSRKRNRRRR